MTVGIPHGRTTTNVAPRLRLVEATECYRFRELRDLRLCHYRAGFTEVSEALPLLTSLAPQGIPAALQVLLVRRPET
jgi:hypothetical protein